MGTEGIDAIVDHVTKSLIKLDKALPRAKFSKHIKPYWNETLTLLKKEKVKLYRLWKSNGCPRDADNQFWCDHKNAKRKFRKELKRLQRCYEQKEIEELVNAADCNKNRFWGMVKNAKQQTHSENFAIKNSQEKVVHNIKDVIEAWKEHFSKLASKKSEPQYDDDHYKRVTASVKEWANDDDPGMFLDIPFEKDEISKAVNKLNKGKAAGCDLVTAEHLQNAGPNMITLLTLVYNRLLEIEYIPTNFRMGTQIPLYKGKNTCSLDRNNYRGITLLTSLNKIFEILIWERMKDWWESEQVISPFQGACRPGKSCIHSALSLQESISVGLGTRKKVMVTYLDVAKAFDGVWIDGLFYQLRLKGIVGKVWRLMYATYQDFRCKVRIAGEFSEWYPMECGIHQGGFLSLLKYTAFIDPLLRKIDQDGLGLQVVGVPANPVGYADDMASASVSKTVVDKTLSLVQNHANRWRYSYNAAKSAILVYGETPREHSKNAKYRNFRLGTKRVPEKESYDHLGVKNCLYNNYMARTEERLSKARRAFHALTSLGVKKSGINMSVCSKLFWTIVIPIATYGSEIWVLRNDEVEELRKFQRCIGRRCQRFPKRSPNHSAYASLGWLSIDRYIQIKKLLFIRSITNLDDDDICKRILKVRTNEFVKDIQKHRLNEHDSPVFDLLDVSIRTGMYEICMQMIMNGHYCSKEKWRNMVWERVWSLEDDDYTTMYKQPDQNILLFKVTCNPYYLNWWILSDLFPNRIRTCEKMAALVCDASRLKATDYRLKGKSFSHKVCIKCELGIRETVQHVVMECPYYTDERIKMYDELKEMGNETIDKILAEPQQMFHTLMGKQPEFAQFDEMVIFWLSAGKWISGMYNRAMVGRE